MMTEAAGPIINIDCPCKGCTERHEACHGRCGKYIRWKEALNQNNHERWKEEQRYAISETQKKWLIRNMRKNKR